MVSELAVDDRTARSSAPTTEVTPQTKQQLIDRNQSEHAEIRPRRDVAKYHHLRVCSRGLGFSLATRVFLNFIALLAVAVILSILSIREMRTLSHDLDAVQKNHLRLARLASRLETLEQNRLRDIRRSLDEDNAGNRAVIVRLTQAYFPEVVRATLDEIESTSPSSMAGVRETTDVDRFHRTISRHTQALQQNHAALDSLAQSIATDTSSVGREQRELDRIESSLRVEGFQLKKAIREETERAFRAAQRQESRATWRVLVFTGIAALLGIVLSVATARALSPIRPIVWYAQAIGRGDFSKEPKLRAGGELLGLYDELRMLARSQKAREDELDQQTRELEKAYRRVAELKRYHESVVQSLRTSLIVVDPQSVVASLNRAAERVWGLSPDEVCGTALDNFPLGRALIPHLLDATPQRAENTTAVAQVENRIIELTTAPLRNANDEIEGTLFAIEDVTEAAETKEALLRSERLAAIGRMSAHVTHEIRNPLSSIGLNAELLRDTLADHGSAESLLPLIDAIIREVDRLNSMTEAYLQFARLPEPVLETRDLRGLAESAVALVRHEYECCQVHIQLDFPEHPVASRIDPEQIRRALLNLLRNAKEAMPEGGQITLRVEAEDRTSVVEISDQGTGIPAEAVDRIFDPFYSTKLTGTGLGLALCQQTVQEHGGSIAVASTGMTGTTFRLRLPGAREISQFHPVIPS
jgi:PAS domain S-box-containing protein